ncbi:MAG: hypothetical protein D6702_02480 [Planctomycetota bacterium]|nr:MAG: hypothetical protein D6702_02480 [Planctomycetota bacterium]
MKRVAALAVVGLASAGLSAAAAYFGGTFELTLHGDPVRGVSGRAGVETGDCSQCHYTHASDQGTSLPAHDMLLPMANDDNLCFVCHAGAGAEKVYLGQGEATANAHATSNAFRWPGPVPPARPAGDQGKCLNCHDPHGFADASGLIPRMAVAREQNSCLTCHDGNGPAADDIAGELQRAYAHPVATIDGKHDAGEGGTPGNFAGGNRHAECEDCHNPHAARENTGGTQPPVAGEPLRGVSSVRVTNGAAGTSPIYTWVDGDQNLLSGPKEYEVCFKCHSGWTTLPVGAEDLAVELNPNNPSYHPVEAQGNDPNIRAGSFVNGWTATSVVLCSDCHRSPDPQSPAGPHGSDQRALLAGSWPANTQKQITPPDLICFQCHRYDTYANDGASDTIKGYSRFNRPAFSKGHTFHVDKKQRPCAACHEVHGSHSLPSLIRIGANPGLNQYQQNNNGGQCWPTCHGSKSYNRLNYGR